LKKNIKYYLLILIVASIAAGSVYLAILVDFFTISPIDTTTECPPVYLGENALEQLNVRLLYISLGNVVLILSIFTAFYFSLKPVTLKNNIASLLICVIASIPLIQTIYNGRGLAIETITKCESHIGLHMVPSIPNIEDHGSLAIPPDYKLNLKDLN